MTPVDFLTKALAGATASGHAWPEYAACEAALETGWGGSGLCQRANNLFGQKQGPQTAGLPTITIPTREFIHGQWVVVDAVWPVFASWADSFSARMELLTALAGEYPNYAAALAASNGEDFVTEVSKTWSTDPTRGAQVLAIHRRHFVNGAVQ